MDDNLKAQLMVWATENYDMRRLGRTVFIIPLPPNHFNPNTLDMGNSGRIR
jgi:hypothetical protein